MENEPIDVTSTAVAVRESQAVAPVPTTDKSAVTPAQAKVDAVACLTMAAYQKASQLVLTPGEIEKLQADFPDEAFQPGAAGKENLIYIEHAWLRDRLNQVFGPGQWAIVPRSRWCEDYTFTNKHNQKIEASRVYVEAMLLIRGAFVAEAVGDMVYYKNNESQNYGDAVEGAKTAALRRCAKELGIGLQAWKKDFGAGWWQRRGSGQRRTAPAQPAPAPAPAPAPKPDNPKELPAYLEKCKTAFLQRVQPLKDYALQYFLEQDFITDTEQLDAVSVTKLFPSVDVQAGPKSAQAKIKIDAEKHLTEIRKFAGVGDPPEPEPETIDVPDELNPDNPQDPNSPNAVWRAFPMPFGKMAGKTLAELDKKYLYGLWANFTVETEYNGKPKKAESIEKDKQLRAMLDMAGVHYEFTKKD